MRNEDLCPMSDLPADQCALPCHRNERLPRGLEPEVVRGVEPSGVRRPLTVAAVEQHDVREHRPHTRKPTGKPVDCRHDPESGEWHIREHVRDCRSHTCQGCKPCEGAHCALFGSCPNHVNPDVGIFTCPAHIGEARGIISDIESLTALVHFELEHSSDNSEVVNLAGPFADPDQLDARRDLIVRRDSHRGLCDWPRLSLFDVDDRHPVAVFTRWERDLRREYEQPDVETGESERWPLPHKEERDLLSRSATYFRRMLDGRFPHDEPFEKFLRDLRRLRGYLEDVLSDSHRPDMGAPCPKCAQHLDQTRPAAPVCVVCRHDSCRTIRASAPRLVKRHNDGDRTGASDRWECPDYPDDHWWKEADYRLRVAGEYLAHANRLTADQIHSQYGIPAGTIRRWANPVRRLVAGEWVEQPALIRPVGRTAHGVRLYDVSEVLKLRRESA